MRLRALLSHLATWLEAKGLPTLLRSRIGTSLYAALIAPWGYIREIRAVSAGQFLFFRASPGPHSPLLRRNIHRLEKGLSMQPRAQIFATEYIVETVEAYRGLRLSRGGDATELIWAEDVLQTFFEVVEDSPEVLEARARFNALARLANRPPEDIPAARKTLPESRVDYETFLGLCRQRKSVRWFLPHRPSRETIEYALRAALLAPSACNRQPFLFRYFDDPEEASRIAKIAMGTAGYADQIPALVVVLGDFSCFPSMRDRHVPYIDASLASMQFMLALETLGLASCAINWPDISGRERRMREALRLPPHLRPIMLIALGLPDPNGVVPHSAKKPTSSVLRTEGAILP